MGCIISNIGCVRTDKPISVSATREALAVEVVTARDDANMNIISSIVCEIIRGNYRWFRVRKGGILRTRDGKKLIVKKAEV